MPETTETNHLEEALRAMLDAFEPYTRRIGRHLADGARAAFEDAAVAKAKRALAEGADRA